MKNPTYIKAMQITDNKKRNQNIGEGRCSCRRKGSGWRRRIWEKRRLYID
jgi:hypothetical protein